MQLVDQQLNILFYFCLNRYRKLFKFSIFRGKQETIFQIVKNKPFGVSSYFIKCKPKKTG